MKFFNKFYLLFMLILIKLNQFIEKASFIFEFNQKPNLFLAFTHSPLP